MTRVSSSELRLSPPAAGGAACWGPQLEKFPCPQDRTAWPRGQPALLNGQWRHINGSSPAKLFPHPPPLNLECSRRAVPISELFVGWTEASITTALPFSFPHSPVLYPSHPRTHYSWECFLANFLQTNLHLSSGEPDLWHCVTFKTL